MSSVRRAIQAEKRPTSEVGHIRLTLEVGQGETPTINQGFTIGEMASHF